MEQNELRSMSKEELKKKQDELFQQQDWAGMLEISRVLLMDDESCHPVINIPEAELAEYSNGGRGCTIYCGLWNPSEYPLDIEIIDSFIINEQREQHRKDSFLTGFIVDGNVTIQPNATVRRGEIYLESTSGNLCPGWRYGIEVKNKKTGQTHRTVYEVDSIGLWNEVSDELIDSLDKQLKSKVERIEEFENKKGIRLESISFSVQDDSLTVFFDLFAIEQGKLKEKVLIKCVCYDKDGDIIGSDDVSIYPDDFMGYASMDIYIGDIDTKRIERVRICPQ